MEATFREMVLKLPGDVVDSISSREIVNLLLDKALGKAEYYLSKCGEFEEKYHSSFTDFKRKVDENRHEVFSEWDDLILWEGFELAYREWKKKYEDLKNCRE